MRTGIIKTFTWHESLPGTMIGVIDEFSGSLSVFTFAPVYNANLSFHQPFTIEEMFERLLKRRIGFYETT